MRAIARHSLLLIAILPISHALQTYVGQDSCPWRPLSLASEQYVCTSENMMHSPEDKRNSGGSRRSDGTGGPESSIWNASSDCFGDYCVYTNTNFFGQGISLITTAPNHIQVAQIQASGPPLSLYDGKARIAEIPGKGRGLVATRIIRRGERIMAAKPALLVHRRAFGELRLEHVSYLMDTAINSLPKLRRESYLAQAATMGGYKIIDILFTNSFQISVGDNDGFHYGNFPEVSILNHDCRPNLAFFVDNNLTHHTHAVRDIEPGEELTISYLDALEVRSLRQQRTQSTFGFSCGCPRCTLSKEESDASDERLRAISRLERELSDINSQTCSPAMIEEYLALYKAERLEYKIAGAYTLAALNYNFLGEAAMAKKYARLSAEAGLLESGPGGADVREMKIIADDPKMHWSSNIKR